MSPKIPKDPNDGGNVGPTKPPEPKVNQEEWQYVKPKFVPPNWELIKRVDTMSLVTVFEMFYGRGKIASEHLTYLAMADNPQQPDFDIFTLFAGKIKEGYFGDFIGRYGELGVGGLRDLGWLNSLTSFPLPKDKVFSFIHDKDITGLLKSYGHEIQLDLQELIRHFSVNEKPEASGSSEAQEEKKILPASPTSNKGKMATLRSQCVSLFAEKLKENPTLTAPQLVKDREYKALVKNSGLPENKYPSEENVKKEWVKEARKLAKVESKHGVTPK